MLESLQHLHRGLVGHFRSIASLGHRAVVVQRVLHLLHPHVAHLQHQVPFDVEHARESGAERRNSALWVHRGHHLCHPTKHVSVSEKQEHPHAQGLGVGVGRSKLAVGSTGQRPASIVPRVRDKVLGGGPHHVEPVSGRNNHHPVAFQHEGVLLGRFGGSLRGKIESPVGLHVVQHVQHVQQPRRRLGKASSGVRHSVVVQIGVVVSASVAQNAVDVDKPQRVQSGVPRQHRGGQHQLLYLKSGTHGRKRRQTAVGVRLVPSHLQGDNVVQAPRQLGVVNGQFTGGERGLGGSAQGGGASGDVIGVPQCSAAWVERQLVGGQVVKANQPQAHAKRQHRALVEVGQVGQLGWVEERNGGGHRLGRPQLICVRGVVSHEELCRERHHYIGKKRVDNQQVQGFL
ncbi:hypothetical protein DICA4_C03158 [Diutina catenulata]